MATRSIDQTIMQKKIPFFILILMILGGLFSISIIIRLLSPFGAIVIRIGGLLVFLAVFLGSILILYKQIAYFHYHLFEDELLMEKVFGRMHHLFLSVKLDELDFFGPYQQAKVRNSRVKEKTVQYRFVSGKNSDDWYVGEFLRSGKRYRFIIAPNEELLKAIYSFIESKKNDSPCCIKK
jgi:hypothetical protein